MAAKTFKLKIELGNEAMLTPEDVADALETVAAKLRNGNRQLPIFDTHGNKVGDYELR